MTICIIFDFPDSFLALLNDVEVLPSPEDCVGVLLEEGRDLIQSEAVPLLPEVVIVLHGQAFFV